MGSFVDAENERSDVQTLDNSSSPILVAESGEPAEIASEENVVSATAINDEKCSSIDEQPQPSRPVTASATIKDFPLSVGRQQSKEPSETSVEDQTSSSVDENPSKNDATTYKYVEAHTSVQEQPIATMSEYTSSSEVNTQQFDASKETETCIIENVPETTETSVVVSLDVRSLVEASDVDDVDISSLIEELEPIQPSSESKNSTEEIGEQSNTHVAAEEEQEQVIETNRKNESVYNRAMKVAELKIASQDSISTEEINDSVVHKNDGVEKGFQQIDESQVLTNAEDILAIGKISVQADVEGSQKNANESPMNKIESKDSSTKAAFCDIAIVKELEKFTSLKGNQQAVADANTNENNADVASNFGITTNEPEKAQQGAIDTNTNEKKLDECAEDVVPIITKESEKSIKIEPVEGTKNIVPDPEVVHELENSINTEGKEHFVNDNKPEDSKTKVIPDDGIITKESTSTSFSPPPPPPSRPPPVRHYEMVNIKKTSRMTPVIPEIAYSRPNPTIEDILSGPSNDDLTDVGSGDLINMASTDASYFTTSSQVTTRRENKGGIRAIENDTERARLRQLALKSVGMAAVQEGTTSHLNMGKPKCDAWAAKQGCAPPPTIGDFELVNMKDAGPQRTYQQPQVVTKTDSGSTNSSSSSAVPTQTFQNLAPVKAKNGVLVDIGRLIVVGVVSLVGGIFASIFVDITCNFVSIAKEVGYYGEILTVHAGMSQFTSIDSVFLGQSFCIAYDHEYYSKEAPSFARTSGALAAVAGLLASATVWHYVFTKGTSAPVWNFSICCAALAAIFQLGTFQFFFSSVCAEESCGFGAGSFMSLIATGVYVYTAFEMHRNSPVRALIDIDKDSLLSTSALSYAAPEMV
mmetsp:Transcript_9668/g.14487  ORF Transcript_9668/g.14487 Transcript_9668/m.14487 type:complete len:870 (-) Transcript_9668:84-2693(-)